nr:hypothetical protein [Candidatus Neomarinimicrobiota bacterium]
MKKPYPLLCILFLIYWSCEDTKEEESTIIFSKIFGGSGWDQLSFIQQTTDDGYIIIGTTESFGNGNDDIWLIKTDSRGNEDWCPTFGGSEDDRGYSVQQTTDGCYVIVGTTKSYGNGGFDTWLIKIDSKGNKLWDQTFGDELYEIGKSIYEISDGFIILAEISFFDGYPQPDPKYGHRALWLIQTDSDGNKEWDQIYGGNLTEYADCVQQTADGGYIILGTTTSYGNGEYDVWLIKTDSEGNEIWNKTFGGSDSDKGNHVEQTTDGGYLIVGYTDSFGNDSSGVWSTPRDFWLIKTDSEGNEIWSKTFGGDKSDEGHDILAIDGGGMVVLGETHSQGDDDGDIWLLELDADGNIVDTVLIGGVGLQIGYSFVKSDLGGY